jgi:hypothetical protein
MMAIVTGAMSTRSPLAVLIITPPLAPVPIPGHRPQHLLAGLGNPINYQSTADRRGTVKDSTQNDL